MKIYTVTGHSIDFEGSYTNLFETEVYMRAEEAEEAALQMADDAFNEMVETGSDEDSVQRVKVDRIEPNGNEFDHDFMVTDCHSKVTEIHVRMVEV